jgi:hypothetical protein
VLWDLPRARLTFWFKDTFIESHAGKRRLQQKEPVHINVATTVRATESALQRTQAHEDLVISLQPNRLELETVVFVEPYRYHVLRV